MLMIRMFFKEIHVSSLVECFFPLVGMIIYRMDRASGLDPFFFDLLSE